MSSHYEIHTRLFIGNLLYKSWLHPSVPSARSIFYMSELSFQNLQFPPCETWGDRFFVLAFQNSKCIKKRIQLQE